MSAREVLMMPGIASGVGLCVLYALAASVGLELRFPSSVLSVGVLWLPLGVLFGWLYRAPRRQWPALMLWALAGQWLAEVPRGIAVINATEMFAIDAAQVAAGVWLTQWLSPGAVLRSTRGMLTLIFAGAVGPALIFGVVKTSYRMLVGIETDAWEAWCCFATSNVLSVLTVAPPVIAWQGPPKPWLTRLSGRTVELALLVIGLTAATLLTFAPVFPPASNFGFTAAAPLPLLLWAAMRFGTAGIGPSVALLALTSGWLETGPFIVGPPLENVLAYQVFLCVVLVSNMLLSAALDDRAQIMFDAARSDRRYRELIEHQTEMICRYRQDTTLTFVNHAYCEFRGLTEAELVGTRWIDRHPVEDRPRLLEMVNRAFTTQQTPRSTMVEEPRANGESGWTQWVDSIVFDEAGEVREIQGMGHDVTELVRANEALRRSQERLNAAMDAAKLGVWELDLSSGRPWWSDRLVEMSGLSPSDFTNTDTAIDASAHPEDRQLLREQMAGMAEGMSHHLRFRLVKPNGEIRWIEGGGGLVRDETGTPRWLTGIAGDVTERVTQEATLRRALDNVEQLKNQLQTDNAVLLEELSPRTPFGDFVFASETMQAILSRADRVAPTETAVLITGETGTGKELLARAIHERSRRRERPLVRVNCAALHASLVESELFGHEKGAYTGAAFQRAGRFEVADGGTLFLDEIGELSAEVQAKLLRVLQNGEFERLGSSKTISTNVRLIAATNRDLGRSVREGTFRADLFYRLNVFPIHIPPLRDRPEDIAPIAAHVLRNVSVRLGRSFDAMGMSTLAALQKYPWPGNTRELENVIERAAVLANGSTLRLPPGWDASVESPASKSTNTPPSGILAAELRDATLEDVERLHILGVLERTHWRIEGPRGAAVILGINPSTLRSRLARLGIRSNP